MLHSLLGEELEGIRDSKWGDSSALGKFQIAHRQDIGWWCEIYMFLGIEIIGAWRMHGQRLEVGLDIWVCLGHER